MNEASGPSDSCRALCRRLQTRHGTLRTSSCRYLLCCPPACRRKKATDARSRLEFQSEFDSKFETQFETKLETTFESKLESSKSPASYQSPSSSSARN